MFCYLSHLVEDCYFDEIEMFFLVVGHTHNILDQWFSVLANAVGTANFIGSVLALHALYKLAHSDDASRCKHVHQLETYHDWVKFYAPVANKDIHNYQIPLRWRVTRDKLLSVAKCDYQVVSPPAGMKHLERWQPEVSSIFDNKLDGTVEMEMFMTLGGAETMFKAIGIDTARNSDSLAMLKSIASKDQQSAHLAGIAETLPIIRQIELNVIGETRKRMEQEADNGQSDPQLATTVLSNDILEAIDREITRSNSKNGGRIVWLKRSQITSDPEQLNRQPDVLPNPGMWQATIQANGSSAAEVGIAKARMTKFQKGAGEIAATAAQMIVRVEKTKTIGLSADNDIVSATSKFTRLVLTQRELDWYKSIQSVSLITSQVQRRVQQQLSKPWQLLDVPDLTPEQLAWRERRRAEKAKIFAQTEARLRQGLNWRAGEGEYNPTLQVVSMDGFNAAENIDDIDSMRLPQLRELAKGHVKNYYKLKSAELKTALKKLMETTPGLFHQVSAAIPASGPIVAGAEAQITGLCSVFECEEAAVNWCNHCRLQFCNSLNHGIHDSHNMQLKRAGRRSFIATEVVIDDADDVEDEDAAADDDDDHVDGDNADYDDEDIEADAQGISHTESSHDIRSIAPDVHQLSVPGAPSASQAVVVKRARVAFSAQANSPAIAAPEDTVVRPSALTKRRRIAQPIVSAPLTSTTTTGSAAAPLTAVVTDCVLGTVTPTQFPVLSISALGGTAAAVPIRRTFEFDNAEKRKVLEEKKVADAVFFLRSAQSAGSISRDTLISQFRSESFYDTAFFCALANALAIDVSAVVSRRRFTRKDLLHCFLDNLLK